jgi:hypothetical protein
LWLILLLSFTFARAAGFGTPTARAALEYVSVMQQAVQHRADSPLCGERRWYLPSDVVLGTPHHLVAKQARAGQR